MQQTSYESDKVGWVSCSNFTCTEQTHICDRASLLLNVLLIVLWGSGWSIASLILMSSVVFSMSLGNTHQGRDTFLLLSIPILQYTLDTYCFVIKSNFLQLSGVALMYWLHESHKDHWPSWGTVFKRSIKHTINCDSSHRCTIYPLFMCYLWR